MLAALWHGLRTVPPGLTAVLPAPVGPGRMPGRPVVSGDRAPGRVLSSQADGLFLRAGSAQRLFHLAPKPAPPGLLCLGQLIQRFAADSGEVCVV